MRRLLLALIAVFLIVLCKSEQGLSLFESLNPISIPEKLFVFTSVIVLLFLIVSYCLILGKLILRNIGLFRDDHVLAIAVGFTATTLLIAFLGSVGWINENLSLVIFCGVLALHVIFPDDLLKALKDLREQWKEWGAHKVIFTILATFLFFKWAQGWLPLTHGDPTYYHLPSAWLWAEKGSIYFIDWLPWSLQGGIGEYFYTFLASLTQNRFLMMLECQMFHYFFGYVLSSVLVYKIARSLMSQKYALLAVLAFVTFPNEALMMVRAKNDGFVLFFCLLSVFEGMRYWQDSAWKRLPLIYGASWYAVSLKWSALFFVIPFFVVFGIMTLLKLKQDRQNALIKTSFHHIAWALAGFTLALPILLRNYIFTENPMFPTFNSIFKSPFINSYLEGVIGHYSYVPGTWFEIIYSNFNRFLFAKISYVFFVLIPFVKLNQKRSATYLFMLGLSGIGILMLVTGQGYYARFAFFLYALFAIGSMAVLDRFETKLKDLTSVPRFLKASYIYVVFALIIFNSTIEVPVNSFFSRTIKYLASSQTYASYYAEVKDSYLMHRWINEHLPKNAKIFSFIDNECFFLDRPLSVQENHLGASEVGQVATYEEAVLKFSKLGFTHVQIPKYAEKTFPLLSENPAFEKDFVLIHEENNYRLFQKVSL